MEKAFAEWENLNPHAEMYQARLKEHLALGLRGYVGGVLLWLIMLITIFAENGGVNDSILPNIAFSVFISLLAGFAFAGFPYGWKIINGALDRFTGRRIIVIDIIIYIFLFILKLVVAVWIGLVVYPVVLVYYFIRSRKTKRKVRIWSIIAISSVILLYATIGISIWVDAKSNEAEANATAVAVRAVTVDSFHNQNALVNRMCQNALTTTQAKENENVNDLGWVVSESTQLHGIFFLEEVDSDRPHYINSRLSLANAVVVVTGYFLVEAGPVPENQWEMDVRIYPNFSFDEDQVLIYDIDHVYDHSLRVEDMEKLMEWLCGQYSDMKITEIPIS